MSFGKRNIFSFDEGGYLPLAEPVHQPMENGRIFPVAGQTLATLKERVRAFCAANGADPGPSGKVLLVTLPRIIGYKFNPVSFYFCSDSSGRPVGAIAEVTNTFHEVKPYFIPAGATARMPATFRRRTPKHFYVSPFSGLDLEFDFTLHFPDARLAVRIDDHQAGRRMLHTTLTGQHTGLTDARLAWFFIKYPLVTLAVMGRIHWQALCLWLKQVPWYPKADKPLDQRDLYRPHSSLTRTRSST
jgi:DUF1365 family protein